MEYNTSLDNRITQKQTQKKGVSDLVWLFYTRITASFSLFSSVAPSVAIPTGEVASSKLSSWLKSWYVNVLMGTLGLAMEALVALATRVRDKGIIVEGMGFGAIKLDPPAAVVAVA